MFDYHNRWSDDPDNSLRLARHNAEQAIQKDPNEPLARFAASLAAMFGKDLDRAKSEAEIALSLNPNFALAYASSWHHSQLYSGQPLAAISAIERAMRLDPASSQQYLHFLGTAYLLAGKYETAAALLRQRVLLVPGTDFTRAMLASALGHLGEVDEARRIWRELKEINPKYSFSEHFARQPFKREGRPADCRGSRESRIADGLTTLHATRPPPIKRAADRSTGADFPKTHRQYPPAALDTKPLQQHWFTVQVHVQIVIQLELDPRASCRDQYRRERPPHPPAANGRTRQGAPHNPVRAG